jgi:hypothetical protein
MQLTKISIQPSPPSDRYKAPPSWLDRSEIERIFEVSTSKGLHNRVTTQHKKECHPDTPPWNAIKLNPAYSALDEAAKETFRRRCAQVKKLKKQKEPSVEEVDDLVGWLRTEISKPSYLCTIYSTYKLKVT